MIREKEREMDSEREKISMINDTNEKLKSDVNYLWEQLNQAEANISNKSNNVMWHE